MCLKYLFLLVFACFLLHILNWEKSLVFSCRYFSSLHLKKRRIWCVKDPDSKLMVSHEVSHEVLLFSWGAPFLMRCSFFNWVNFKLTTTKKQAPVIYLSSWKLFNFSNAIISIVDIKYSDWYESPTYLIVHI